MAPPSVPHAIFDLSTALQADNMWKMLDDLAVTDSAAYAEMARAGAEAMVGVLSI